MKSFVEKKISRAFIIVYFTVSMIEIVAEYFNDKTLILIFKPLLLPLLVGYYFYKSKKRNILFITSLFFSWIANIIFIYDSMSYIILGSVFFLIYRAIIIYLVVKLVKMPSKTPLLIGLIPFLFIYTTTCFYTYEEFGVGIILFIIHGVFIIFLGGYSMGNYIVYSSKTNLYLFISTMLFAISQFLFVLKIYSDYVYLLHALAMLLFVFAQYLLVKFVHLKEKPKSKYEFVKNINEL